MNLQSAVKWLELLKQIAPRTERVALLFNPTTAVAPQLFVSHIEAAASSHAVQVSVAPVRAKDEIEGVIAVHARNSGGGLIVMPDAFFFDVPTRHLIVALVARNSVPTVYFNRVFVEAGGLAAYSADFSEQLRQAAEVARANALEAEIVEVHVADDFEQALESAKTKQVGAGILLSSPLVFNASKQIGEIAIAKRLPLISLFAVFPKSGGLISYGPNVADLFRICGGYVGKILHGAKPSDLPIQRPEKFDLVINLKTAAALGVDVPSQLQQLADEVIE